MGAGGPPWLNISKLLEQDLLIVLTLHYRSVFHCPTPPGTMSALPVQGAFLVVHKQKVKGEKKEDILLKGLNSIRILESRTPHPVL